MLLIVHIRANISQYRLLYIKVLNCRWAGTISCQLGTDDDRSQPGARAGSTITVVPQYEKPGPQTQ